MGRKVRELYWIGGGRVIKEIDWVVGGFVCQTMLDSMCVVQLSTGMEN